MFLFIFVNSLFGQAKEMLLLTYSLPDEIVNWYDRNYQDPNAEGSWKLCKVFRQPDSSAEAAGEIWVKYEKDLRWFIIFFKPDNQKDLLVWNKEPGDIGYGINEFVVDDSLGYVKLPGKIFSGDAWIKLDYNGGINGEVRPVTGGLYYMPGLKAVDLSTGKETRLTNEVYYIISGDESGFMIRKEIPGDMPCGDEIINHIEESKIQKYKISFEDLFDSEGRAAVSLAYPRGC